METFIWWTQHAPRWQFVIFAGLALTLIIVIITTKPPKPRKKKYKMRN